MIQSLSSIYLTVKDHLKGGRKTHLEIDKHISNKSNPHQISKSQIESVLTGTITSVKPLLNTQYEAQYIVEGNSLRIKLSGIPVIIKINH